MHIKITTKCKQEFNKNWKKVTSNSAYLIPEAIEDFKSLGPFPYFKIENIWIFPKAHTSDAIHRFTEFIYEIVGRKFFTWSTVYEAIRGEIRLYFSTQPKQTSEWHFNHLLGSIFSKNKKRLFVRSIRGLKIENFDAIHRNFWQLITFTENEIKKFCEQESGNNQWKSQVKEYLTRNFKDKTCLLVEAEGDFETAKRKAQSIASFVINTLRYFICIHISHTGRAHDVGIMLDSVNVNHGLNAFSIDLESSTSTMFGYGAKFRQEYPLRQDYLDIIKSQWGAERLWGLIEKDELNDLESSIISSIAWLGDAHQEDDINLSYVKYWIAIEALLTGHKKDDINTRIKNTIPIMISQFSQESPTKTEVDKAYELRGKVVHGGTQDIVKQNDLNKVCVWTTQCLSVCTHLLDKGYVSRDEIEIQINRLKCGERHQK